MKKLLILISSSALLCSCGGGLSDRPMGMLYANVSDPVAVTSSSGSRTGVATATSYLGLVAVGDSSISAAKAQGGISTVSSVDVKRETSLASSASTPPPSKATDPSCGVSIQPHAERRAVPPPPVFPFCSP